LADWSCTNNLHTLYDPKQLTSFQSARWNSGTNPDVTFSTLIRGTISTREVFEQFPHSQHRPSLIRTMPLISFTRSAPIPRWNFRKADWERYKDLTNNLADSLPTPRMHNINFAYKQFTQTLKTVAKQTILKGFRKSYIPTWDEECSRLYKEYLNADSQDTIHSSASALTDLLDKKRHDRWIDTVSNIDFTQSSRKA